MISCQVSLYPLGSDTYAEAISEAIAELEASAVRVQVGPMSTLIWGKEDQVWAAVRRLFDAATRTGGTAVLTMNLSNACAIPD